MEEVDLWGPVEEEGSDISSEEEDGPGPPPLSMFFFYLSFVQEMR